MKQVWALAILPLFALNLSLFLLPGWAAAMLAGRRRGGLSANAAVMLTVVVSAALGYAAFWAYFASRWLGRAFSYCVIVASVAVVLRSLRRGGAPRALARQMAVPFVWVLAVGACYTCLLFLFQDPFTSGAELANIRFFGQERPGDDRIPLIFAERIYAQAPVRPFCCGDWLSSDRPPLQGGMFLLERPLKAFGNVRLNYELFGTGVECLWICGVWVLLNALRSPPARVKQTLGLLIFSGFLFYNSVYVWPKLLAATFVLFVFGILFDVRISGRRMTWLDTGLAAGSFALALLAHPGSIFSGPALLILTIRTPGFWNARKLAAGAVLILALLAPWVAYQKLYDPPGNRLLKMHLAGIGPIDTRSAWQAVKDTYGSMSWRQIAEYKWANVATLIGPRPFPAGGWEQIRIDEREYVWNALGILNAGWMALVIAMLRRRKAAVWGSGALIGMAVLNLLVWCVVLIGPAYTLTEHGSYADWLMLAIGLLGFLLTLPRAVLLAAFMLQILNLFCLWVVAKPALMGAGELQIGLLAAGAGLAIALAWHFGRSYLAAATSFSTCLARMSTSRLTREPAE